MHRLTYTRLDVMSQPTRPKSSRLAPPFSTGPLWTGLVVDPMGTWYSDINIRSSIYLQRLQINRRIGSGKLGRKTKGICRVSYTSWPGSRRMCAELPCKLQQRTTGPVLSPPRGLESVQFHSLDGQLKLMHMDMHAYSELEYT